MQWPATSEKKRFYKMYYQRKVKIFTNVTLDIQLYLSMKLYLTAYSAYIYLFLSRGVFHGLKSHQSHQNVSTRYDPLSMFFLE